MSKINWFDSKGQNYAEFRPGYPQELLAWVASTAKNHQLLWDCATGNGQAACALAEYFETIIATDSASSQIEAATPNPRVHFKVASAEQSGLDNNSVDCITIAQALHWFANETFFNEARRVAKPGASIAAWCYATAVLEDKEMNSVWLKCYDEYLRPYFPPGREHVDNAYATIPFPFSHKQTKTFRQDYSWTLKRFLQYVGTWSATRKYLHTHSIDPIKDLIEPRLLAVHSDLGKEYDVYFDITVHQGIIDN